ncbi:MAG: serine hydrolase [Deltaproteobacteria bacterium]|nr:serine hydrolase [Deltaproteobacteria bacterium]
MMLILQKSQRNGLGWFFSQTARRALAIVLVLGTVSINILSASGCTDENAPSSPGAGQDASTITPTGGSSGGSPIADEAIDASQPQTIADSSGAADGRVSGDTGPRLDGADRPDARVDAGTGGTAGTAGTEAKQDGAAAASGDASAEDSSAIVDADWPTGEPEDYGLDRAVLEAAANSIQAVSRNRYGMVVIRKGVLIYEKYWEGGPDDKHIIYSCTKSWGSTLIGIAVTQGLLNVKDEVRKWVPEPVSGIAPGATVEHVLTQSSQAIPPGTAFQYDMGTLINTLPEVLEAASGMKNHDFYEQYLAKPLGISMIWPECPAGGCPGTRYNEGFVQFGNNPASGAPLEQSPQSSIRDQAKLGWLWANNGMWNGKVIIDPEYIAAGSTPGPGFRATYGYLWWIQNAEQYAAIGGIAECYVNVMPSRQLVIAVMGDVSMSQAGSWASFQSIVNAIRD